VLAPPPTAQRTTRAGIGILALGAAITMLYFGRAFFITVIIAAMIAFLLDPGVEFFMKLRLPRGLASFVVCTISLIFLYLAGVGLYTQSAAILDDLPAYSERINELIDQVVTRVERVEQGIYRTLMPKRLQQ
jgi:predicted PurR-regulated permease PerM